MTYCSCRWCGYNEDGSCGLIIIHINDDICCEDYWEKDEDDDE